MDNLLFYVKQKRITKPLRKLRYGIPRYMHNISCYTRGIPYRMMAAFGHKPAMRAENPYATHLPVLIGLAHLLKVERVIEFGCGQYSTLTFLERAAFPDLVTLHSFENDLAWSEKIAALTKDDPRMNLTFVDKPMSEVVTGVQFQNYDLIFLDDSKDAISRSATIDQVASKCDPSNIIIIHDYEIQAYRDAASVIPNQFTITALNPYTGIVWNEFLISRHRLRRLNKLIKHHSQHVLLEDRDSWIKIFKELF